MSNAACNSLPSGAWAWLCRMEDLLLIHTKSLAAPRAVGVAPAATVFVDPQRMKIEMKLIDSPQQPWFIYDLNLFAGVDAQHLRICNRIRIGRLQSFVHCLAGYGQWVWTTKRQQTR